MVNMPAECTRCGHRFQPTSFVIGGDATNVHISNTRTACPECGGPARVIEGRMNVRDGGIEMISGPQWSFDLVMSLRLALVTALEQDLDDPIAPVEAVSPVLGGRIRSITVDWTRDQKIGLLALIITLLPFFGVTPEHSQEAAHAVWDSVTALLDHAAQSGPPAAPPATR